MLTVKTMLMITKGIISRALPSHALRKRIIPCLIMRRNFHNNTGAGISKNQVKGIDHLRDPRLNKGLAFTLAERQALGIHGLLAARCKTQQEQLEVNRIALDRYEDDLNKYVYLVELQDRNERLFFSFISKYVEKCLPIVYTPTVGLACQKFGLIYRKARGLFITINDKGHIYEVLRNWPEGDIRAIVFTDGERILGLGDLGAYGMNIPVGKLSLYTALAGIPPQLCLPITLDVGTDNKALLEDPIYIGLRQPRVRGQEYDEFIDEFMQACVKRYGQYTLLQFEDFAFANARRLLDKYRDHYNTFNDDIQGTASVAVAGLFAAQRMIQNKKLSDHIYVFLGAGSAAVGIANLVVAAMSEEGVAAETAYSKIYMFDQNGFLSSKRKGAIPDMAKTYAKDIEPQNNFEKLIAIVKPTCIIGCSTVGGAFTPAILNLMAKNAERPIIFALSNPTSKAECTAQQAYDNTEGRCIFASGSPFPPVKYKDKVYTPGQGNNAYVFPGIALGVMAAATHHIPESIFLAAARTLATCVSEEDLAVGRIYPSLQKVKDISLEIAVNVVKLAFQLDISSVHPEPKDIKEYIKRHLYQFEYPSYLPTFYKYPDLPDIKVKPIREAFTLHTPKQGPI